MAMVVAGLVAMVVAMARKGWWPWPWCSHSREGRAMVTMVMAWSWPGWDGGHGISMARMGTAAVGQL